MKSVRVFVLMLFSVINGNDLDENIDDVIKTNLLPKDCTLLEPELSI
jgi:hypothetical protein